MTDSVEALHSMTSVEYFAGRILSLQRDHGRVILGIVGAPGAGKSTFASDLATCLGTETTTVVPMDGFHLAQCELERLGRKERKGAIDTFDAYGFVSLLRRIQHAEGKVVYAPTFDHRLENPIAGAIPVRSSHSVVIVEGNYLLAQEAPWNSVRALLTATWFLKLDDATRQQRLSARHQRQGEPAEAARARSRGSDQRNADLVATTAHRADLVIDVGAAGHTTYRVAMPSAFPRNPEANLGVNSV